VYSSVAPTLLIEDMSSVRHRHIWLLPINSLSQIITGIVVSVSMSCPVSLLHRCIVVSYIVIWRYFLVEELWIGPLPIRCRIVRDDFMAVGYAIFLLCCDRFRWNFFYDSSDQLKWFIIDFLLNWSWMIFGLNLVVSNCTEQQLKNEKKIKFTLTHPSSHPNTVIPKTRI
jgi:hypothetical protein